MMVHIGQPDVAELAHNAWLRTVEDGVHTYDIFKEGVSKQKVGTKEFAQAVVDRLGQQPETLKPVEYEKPEVIAVADRKPIYSIREPQKKDLVGIDVFINWWNGEFYGSGNTVGPIVEALSGGGLELVMVSNRGTKVYPKGQPDTFCVDQWRCRFMAAENGATISHQEVIDLLGRFNAAGIDFIKTEHLYNFDGQPGYSMGQGQ